MIIQVLTTPLDLFSIFIQCSHATQKHKWGFGSKKRAWLWPFDNKKNALTVLKMQVMPLFADCDYLTCVESYYNDKIIS